MGVDVIGKRANTFQRSWWYWIRIWKLTIDVTPKLSGNACYQRESANSALILLYLIPVERSEKQITKFSFGGHGCLLQIGRIRFRG